MTFETEKMSIDYWLNYLESRGFENCQNVSDDMNYYDIYAEKSGKRWIFEIKRRNMDSNKYGDGLMGEYKYF